MIVLIVTASGIGMAQGTGAMSRSGSGVSLSGKDSLQAPKKSTSKKTNIGGVFVAPTMGISFPTGKFGDLSNSGFFYGAKLEIGYSRLYPFVLGIVFENQSNPGNPEFTTTNFLTQFDTEITYYGASVDIILNKYIKSNFTTPVFSLEGKFANIKRTVAPDTSVPEIPREESMFTYSVGLAFTLYIFDVGGKYTFAGDYSNLTFNAKFHFPLFRF
ncbi:MAG: hypothetical protein K1X85_03545 [Ignavibacteria bacterium]|nr:hypothetical protein [Ignavibacteria bacterium]